MAYHSTKKCQWTLAEDKKFSAQKGAKTGH